MLALNGDRTTRTATALVVLAVAAFAATVSFAHIYLLGRMHGQDGTAARLLPLSVDGLIAAASLVMLYAARQGVPAPSLARWMRPPGHRGTVGANVLYGAPYGPVGAVVSAWPALSFIGCVELLAWMIRAAAAKGAPGTVMDAVPGEVPATAPEVEVDHLTVPASTVSPVPAGVPETVPGTVPGTVPADVPEIQPVTASEIHGPAVPARRSQARHGRAPASKSQVPAQRGQTRARRAPASKAQVPEKVFAAEIEAGTVPSLRSIKTKMRCGTDRARVIRDQLAKVSREAAPAAA